MASLWGQNELLFGKYSEQYPPWGKNIYVFARFFKKIFKLELIVPDCLNRDACCKNNRIPDKWLFQEFTSIMRALCRARVPGSRLSPGTQDLLIPPPNILCRLLMFPLKPQDGCSSSKYHILTSSKPGTERKEHRNLSGTYCFLTKKENMS